MHKGVSLATILSLGLCTAPHAAELEIYGWSEPISLPGAGISIEAKLDTGADTSSLDASDIRVVRRGENRIVKFKVLNPADDELVSLERPLVRSTRIRRHFGDHQRRRVVLMNVCLDTNLMTIEVNLIDRSNFSYPMLLGRNALAGVALVDSSLSDTSSPNCDDDVTE